VHTVFFGEVVTVHANEDALIEGIPSIERIAPVFYAPDPAGSRGAYSYWDLGEKLGHAFEIGRELKRA